MWQSIKTWWATWEKSETIIWSRVQMFVGALWAAAASTDLAPIVPAKYLPIWLVISGALTEYLRQRNAPDLKPTV